MTSWGWWKWLGPLVKSFFRLFKVCIYRQYQYGTWNRYGYCISFHLKLRKISFIIIKNNSDLFFFGSILSSLFWKVYSTDSTVLYCTVLYWQYCCLPYLCSHYVIYKYCTGLMDLYNLDFKTCVSFASDGARKDYSEKGLFYIVSWQHVLKITTSLSFKSNFFCTVQWMMLYQQCCRQHKQCLDQVQRRQSQLCAG